MLFNLRLVVAPPARHGDPSKHMIRRKSLSAAFGLWFVWGACALAETPAIGDYGGAGLWQTPTARFGDDGDAALGIVANSPYNRLFVNIQPTEGIEATFRYTDITNRLYSSDPNFSGNQSYKDRGLDLRFRLLKESEVLPELALGLRDLGGTQLFGAQYLVASSRYYDFDFSLGLGWGRLGSGGAIDNPFERTSTASAGPGKFSLSSLFASPKLGIFGGVAWDSPIKGLQLLAEYDPNDYQNEPFENPQDVKWPVNFGAKYKSRSGVIAGLSYQRGSVLSFQLGLSLNIAAANGIPKVLDPPPPPVREQMRKMVDVLPAPAAGVEDTVEPAQRVEQALREQRITMTGFAVSDDGLTAKIWLMPTPYRNSQQLIGRAARAVSLVLPDLVQSLHFVEVSNGVEVYEVKMYRSGFERAAARRAASREFQDSVAITAPSREQPEVQYSPDLFPSSGWSINPSLRSSVGGPDSFYFGQLWLKLGGYVNLTPNWSIDGTLGFNIYNNFEDLKLESNSALPHVRSDIKDYLKDGEQSLVRLETNYIQQFAPRWYGRVSAGIFEEMYGGIGGEVLYRPENPHWAVGINVNRVRQRDTNQRFTFRDYEVTTGHLTGYFEFDRPSVLLKLSVGQYLAGDRGGTVDISRQFPNGIRIGAFATKTNVSAREFGEGEFDKGVYIVIPLDAMLPKSATGGGAFLLRPLTRDGGQKVRDGRSLYDITNGAVKIRLPLRDNLYFE
jgi:hypothetical protein